MSWTGTVRCRHCYTEGHNKRSCPALKANMEQRLARDPEDCWAKEYFAKRTANSKRACSYCSESGHNRKTCANLKLAKAKTIEYAAKWRALAKPYFIKAGLGVGTLVRRYSGNPERGELCVVIAIDWEQYDHRLKHERWFRVYPVTLVTVKQLGNQRHGRHVGVPFCADDDTRILHDSDRNQNWSTEIVSPLSAEAVEKQLSDWWLTGNGSVPQIFDKDTKPHHVHDWVGRESF